MAEGVIRRSKRIGKVNSFKDNSERNSTRTVSTDLTTLRRRNNSLKLTVESLRNAYDLLKGSTEQYIEEYLHTLKEKTNLEKLKTKPQLRNSEKLLKNSTVFLTDKVRTMRETMNKYREETEQLLDEVENQVNIEEYQDEAMDQEQPILCSLKEEYRKQQFIQESELPDSDEIIGDKLDKLCEPCLFQNTEKKALYFCKTCDERLCRDCMNFHQVESYNDSYKHKVMGITTMTIYCSPCMLWKKYITAAVCCLDCKDRKPLCNSCAKQHRAMKKTRGHLSFPLDVPYSRDQIKVPSQPLEVRYSGPDVMITQLEKSTKVKLPNGNGIDREQSSYFISRSDQIESQAQQLNKGPDSGQSVLKTLSVEPMMKKILHIKPSETKETTRYEMSLRGVYV